MFDSNNVVTFLIGWLIVLICTSTGVYISTNQFKSEAVRVGHARYVVDNKANVSFEWLATQTAELQENK